MTWPRAIPTTRRFASASTRRTLGLGFGNQSATAGGGRILRTKPLRYILSVGADDPLEWSGDGISTA